MHHLFSDQAKYLGDCLRCRNRKFDEEIKYTSIGILTMLFTCLLAGLFSYPFTLTPFKSMYFGLVAILLNLTSHNQGIPVEARHLKLLKTPFFTCFVILISNTFLTYNSLRRWSNGVIYSQLKQVQELNKDYVILSNNGYYLYYLGNCYLETQQYNEAIVLLRKAKLLLPDKLVFLSLAKAYTKIQRHDLAQQEYQFLMDTFPKEIEKFKLQSSSSDSTLHFKKKSYGN